MEVIKARNVQKAMPTVLDLLYSRGETVDGLVQYRHPVSITVEHPDERLLFWPGMKTNPFGAIANAYRSLATAEAGLETVAQAILAGRREFLFSTPILVLSATVTPENRLDAYAVITERNPLSGIGGQLGLQLSMLHELLAATTKKPLGVLTIQHQRLEMPRADLEQMMLNSLQERPVDPYSELGVKPRGLDAKLEMEMALTAPVGIKSKWTRSVFLPMREIAGLMAEKPQEARKQCGRVKAGDWRLALERFLDA